MAPMSTQAPQPTSKAPNDTTPTQSTTKKGETTPTTETKKPSKLIYQFLGASNTGPQGQQCYTLMGFSILYKNSLLLLLLLLLLIISGLLVCDAYFHVAFQGNDKPIDIFFVT